MANRRVLKKEISFIATELIAECVFNKITLSDEKAEQLDKVIDKILDMEIDFRSRVNKADGKDNPKLVKNYYAQLIVSLDKAIDEIMSEIGQLVEA